MYTRCPICKTNFSVSEAQLQVAQGKVRCGACKNVFNARQHIHYRSTVSTAVKNNPKKNTPPAAQKPESPVSDIKQTTAEARPATSQKTTQHSDIDAIFNALDSQLTSGTYIDIAQPVDTDIREADFDDSLNEAKTDEARISQQPFIESSSEPDLDLKSDASQRLSLNSDIEESNNEASTPDSIDHPDQTKKQTKTQKSQEKDNPQHTFDFISLADEPGLPPEDEEQFSSVNKPLDTKKDIHLKKKNKNAALHAAIDNIIKVDNKITTPFEEQDEHHFVIEMHNEPDVELVDENDIDKLFASTDSLKMSDLKFDKHLTNNQTEEPISILSDNKTQPTSEAEIKFETDSITDNMPPETALRLEDESDNDVPFNQQVDEQLRPENFGTESSAPNSLVDNDFNEDDFNADSLTLKTGDNDFAIEEEIVLASADTNRNDNHIPHQLRDAVASFDQQKPPLSMAKRAVYSLASVLLVLLLAIQLVLFKSTALANNIPALQPLLVSLCNNLPCRYTGNHNSKQIKIVSRDVRLHPKIKGALLISATIINQASYTQPYPTILLKFTDLTGNTVAQRYFPPKDYLGRLNKPFALMPSKKPVQLNIEILDPGSEAINFQFFFL